MKKIKLKMGITSALTVSVVLACVIILNAAVSVISEKHPLKIDLTRDKIYEFSQRTKEVMSELDKEVKAYTLIPEGTQNEYVDYINEYLNKYKSLNDNFKVEYIDPYENPAFMQNYNDGENQASVGSVILTCGEKFKVVTFDQLYTQNSYSGTVQIDMEKKVTNAIMNITGQLSGTKIYYTEGHGEYTMTNLQHILSEEGYASENINIAVSSIPEDASVIICAAPQSDFTAEERDALDKFADKGGKFFYITTPGMQPLERIDNYLAEWGLKVNYDYAIENDETHALSLGNGLPVPTPTLSEHSINEKIKDSKSLMVTPASMSVTINKSSNSAIVTPLFKTTEKSYGKTNLTSSTIDKEDGDIDGPLTLAAISEKIEGGAIMILGSLSSVEANGILEEGAYLNSDFILNSIAYLAGGNEDLGIRAKQVSAEKMTMTPQQVSISSLVLQIIIPIIIILIGLIVWQRRRNK